MEHPFRHATPSPKPKRNGPSFRHYILTSIGMMIIMAGVGSFADRDDTSSTVLQCSDPTSDDHLDLDNDGYSPCEGNCDDNDASPGIEEESETDSYDQDCDNFNPTHE